MLTCPQCGSERVQRTSIVYEAGKSRLAAGTIGGTPRDDGIGLMGAVTFGVSQSELADRLSPPAKRSSWGAALMVLVGVWLCFGLSGWTPRLIGVPLIAAAIWAEIATDQHNKKIPALRAQWDRSFFCWTCGEQFQPPSTFSLS